MEEEFLKFAIETGQEAGERLLSSFREGEPRLRGTGKEVKSVYDEVADKIIRKAIEKKYPEHSYLTEEYGLVKKKSDYLWIIDPLDGTANFENHNPFFSVSIALWQKGKPILGVIEAPFLKERFVAVSGAGARHEDFFIGVEKEARVSTIQDLKKSYFASCEGGEKDKGRVASLFQEIYSQAKDARKLGSASLELAWVGIGRLEGYLTTKIPLWDIAAGTLFVKEAGGEILHFDGTPYNWEEFQPEGNFDILVTNGKIKINLKK
jgi:myo-inositol-1(or 4)-monophosphatase